jgi:hypothetical protein
MSFIDFAEVKARCSIEQAAKTRQRLQRMAAYYLQITEIDEWAAARPTSIASGGEVFVEKQAHPSERRSSAAAARAPNFAWWAVDVWQGSGSR